MQGHRQRRMHRYAKRAMVIWGRTVAAVLLHGRELGMCVAGLYRTHHADHEDACNRNQAQPMGPLPIASSELEQILHWFPVLLPV